ncbi:hypothetical protein L6164_005717 [Bauhinia variegata]|uniref:Uncharacterized protein n=1 Tax=Bauhinia variegata TaxID=167791 RepID=A0ACB9PRG5_BAUVA|nr:hypothetical protein L6164_005717 [Bauhinia variegata]
MAFEGEEDDVVNFEDEDLEEGIGGMLEESFREGLRVINLEGNRFQFFFKNETEMKRVEGGHPWLFKNCLLRHQRWNRETLHDPNSFEMAPFWVQCRGVPLHCQTLSMARKFGEKMGKVLDVAMFELAQGSRWVLKFKAEVNISKPFRKGVWVMGPNKKKFWVDFKVERLPLLCSYCGITGHDMRFCTMASQEEEGGKKREGDWSDFKKVDHKGVRVYGEEKAKQKLKAQNPEAIELSANLIIRKLDSLSVKEKSNKSIESETNIAKEKNTDKEENGVEEIDGNSSDNEKAALRTSPENTQNQGYKEGSLKTLEYNRWQSIICEETNNGTTKGGKGQTMKHTEE